MALIILDPCQVGLSESPEGVVIQMSEVEGFEGHKFLLPLATDRVEKFIEGMKEILKNKPVVQVADLATMKEEVARDGGTPGSVA